MDSQSAKTVGASEDRGIDGGKIKGRKRYTIVDTLENLLAIIVHTANIHDKKAGILPAKQVCKRYPSMKRFCADAGYRGTFVLKAKQILGLGVDISEKIKPHQWEKLPWRWIVERIFAWANHSRRLSKDYELLTSSAEAVFIISHIHTLLKRL